MKTELVGVLAALGIWSVAAHTQLGARTTGTPESVAIQNIKSGIEVFQDENGGRLPTNWAQVDKRLVEALNEERLKGTSVYPLEEHYLFVQEKIPMLGFQEGDVLLIRTEPVRSSAREWGRYIISHTNGVLHFRFYKEERIQQMLSQPGVNELPVARRLLAGSKSPPTQWPLFAVMAVIAAGAIWILVRRSRKT